MSQSHAARLVARRAVLQAALDQALGESVCRTQAGLVIGMVTERGRYEHGAAVSLDAEDAIVLGRWLIDTFGEPHE